MHSFVKRFFILLAIVCLSGCTTIQKINGTYNGLSGSWQFQDSGMRPLVVTFNDDFSYEVDFDGDGLEDIWGHYKLFENRVQLNDEGGQIGKECHEAGFYYYSVLGNRLRYSLLADQCPYRARALNVLWIKMNK